MWSDTEVLPQRLLSQARICVPVQQGDCVQRGVVARCRRVLKVEEKSHSIAVIQVANVVEKVWMFEDRAEILDQGSTHDQTRKRRKRLEEAKAATCVRAIFSDLNIRLRSGETVVSFVSASDKCEIALSGFHPDKSLTGVRSARRLRSCGSQDSPAMSATQVPSM